MIRATSGKGSGGIAESAEFGTRNGCRKERKFRNPLAEINDHAVIHPRGFRRPARDKPTPVARIGGIRTVKQERVSPEFHLTRVHVSRINRG